MRNNHTEHKRIAHSPFSAMAAFFSFLIGSRSSNSSPIPRYAHASAQVGNKAIVYSGRTKEYSKRSRQRLASVVDVFDSYRELWEEKETKGDTPTPGIVFAACATIGDGFFMFGGWDERNDEVYSLHRLDTKTYHWTELSPHGAQGRPMAKADAGMVACGENLVLIGGYGKPHGLIQPGSTFTPVAGSCGHGLTNEIHICHVKEGEGYCLSIQQECQCVLVWIHAPCTQNSLCNTPHS